jgi:uncharacterized protein YggE
MKLNLALIAPAILFTSLSSTAQQMPQPQLRVDPTNRTLTVTATGNVTVEPDLAVLYIGFDTQPEDAQAAYADGARASNAIINAIKQAGILEASIQSQSQYLDRDWGKPHKFKLVQQWTVKVPPERAAEILDVAATAGATSSGQIDWTVKDERALETKALDEASLRVRQNADVLAKGMGVRLGSLIYVSNQVSPVMPRPVLFQAKAMAAGTTAPPPLAIEPNEVSREATVYAIFAIE